MTANCSVGFWLGQKKDISGETEESAIRMIRNRL